MSLPSAKLDAILARHAILTDKLASGADGEAFVALSRELAEVEPVAQSIAAYQACEKEHDEIEAMLADAGTDADMRAMAEAERDDLAARLEEL